MSWSPNKYIGINPFRKSPRNVKTPGSGPAIRYIFVAPGLVDPSILGSPVVIILWVNMANGMEPIK